MKTLSRVINSWVLVVFVLPFVAQGETWKCKMPNGGTQYKDSPCEGENKTHSVHADDVVTDEEIRNARNVHRKNISAVRRYETDKRGGGVVASTGGDARAIASKQREADCRAAGSLVNNRNGENRHIVAACRDKSIADPVSSGTAAKEQARAERERRMNETPALITGCNGGFCYDNKGGTYSKTGGPTLIRHDGKVCQMAGSTGVCN